MRTLSVESLGLSIIALFCTVGSYAEPNKDLYELQERCGKRAADVFKREYGPVSMTKDGRILYNYQNHYSANLQTCFFLEIGVVLEGQARVKLMRLFDLNTTKLYGVFIGGVGDQQSGACYVVGTECRTQDEWLTLIRPYMED